MAATLEISAVLSGFPEVVAGLQRVGATAVKAGTDAARSSADTAKAGQAATAAVVGQQQTQQKAFEATARSALGVRQAFSSFAATLSGTSALLSLFARNNEALQRQLEVVAIASAAAGMSVRVLGAALRFVVTPIGAVVTAVAAAVAIFTHWETVQNAVVAAAIKTWTALGQFFGRLFGSIGSMASGLGQILFGAFTLDWSRIQAGTEQIRKGLGELGQLAIDTGRQFAAGFQSALQALEALLGGLTKVGTQIEEFGLTPLEMRLGDLGKAWGDLGKDIAEAQRLAGDMARQEAEKILTHHEEVQAGLLASTLERIAREREAAAAAQAVADLELENMRLLQEQIGQQMLTQMTAVWKGLTDFATKQWEQIKTSFSESVATMIVTGESFRESLADVWKRVVIDALAAIIKIAIEFIARAVAMAVAGAAAQGALKGGFVGALVEAGLTAAKVIAATVAAFAAGKAAAAAFAQGGLEAVPATATFKLHRGERVLSRRQNVALEEFMAEGMAPGRQRAIEIHYHFEGATIFDEITWERHIRRVNRDLRRLNHGTA
jgi:hypothetical protein